MAFEAEWFHQNVKYLQTAGEDKELEAMLLQQRIYTVYLPDLLVFDEKTQKKEAISNQRKRSVLRYLTYPKHFYKEISITATRYANGCFRHD